VSLAAIYQWMLGVPPHISWTGNKTPTNTENVDRLARAFPDARFIIIVRDPRDVAMSWRRRWDRDERLTAAKWEGRLARGRAHLARLPADRHLVVRYEDILDDLEAACRAICGFLGLPFDERMLSFHEHVTKTIGGQENRGRALVGGNSRKWETGLEPALTRRIEEIAWSGMHEYGYEPARATGPRAITHRERAVGRAQDVRAVLFSPNRLQSVDRRKAHVKRIVLQAKKHLLHRDIAS
jgi:hypothetical protein